LDPIIHYGIRISNGILFGIWIYAYILALTLSIRETIRSHSTKGCHSALFGLLVAGSLKLQAFSWMSGSGGSLRFGLVVVQTRGKTARYVGHPETMFGSKKKQLLVFSTLQQVTARQRRASSSEIEDVRGARQGAGDDLDAALAEAR
jgi:hypothetical protein